MQNRNQPDRSRIRENRNNLRPKLTRIVSAVTLAAFLMTALIVASTSYRSFLRMEIETQKNLIGNITAQINTLQVTAANLALQLITDDGIEEAVEQEKESTGIYLFTKRKTQRTLARYLHVINAAEEILILKGDGDYYSSRDVRSNFVPEENEWFTDFVNSGKTSGFSEIHLSNPTSDGASIEVVSYILSFGASYMIINLRMSEIENMVQVEDDLTNGTVLLDSEGRTLLKEGNPYCDLDTEMESAQVIRLSNEDRVIFSGSMQDGWKLAVTISGFRTMLSAFRAYAFLIVLLAGLYIVIIWILNRSIKRIVDPVNELTEAVSRVGNGDFNVRVKTGTGDELELLGDTFNQMTDDIHRLMEERVEQEKQLRKMEIENLMLQINPHFIYNTMNSIVYMAKMSRNNQIADFANAFISLLQSTLRVRNSVYSTLGEELEVVENYLFLQKYRYEDKFSCEISCPEELKDCRILNVMLQPAVENAIFHGIAPKEGKGTIRIDAQKKDDRLVITIEDDGIGMNEEIRKELLSPEHIQSNGIRKKIGVANVKSRIETIYGEGSNLTIESAPDQGTKVIMVIPCETEADQKIGQEVKSV